MQSRHMPEEPTGIFSAFNQCWLLVKQDISKVSAISIGIGLAGVYNYGYTFEEDNILYPHVRYVVLAFHQGSVQEFLSGGLT